ncbi:TRAP transporter small permease [Leptospira vanthielii]|uniref:TRAP transporter, DctQ-like membrane protein n=1 Tax=Leptospira vanthielii serovar Holland str. Waz Holland = ATCC 700522 TaxID=1218591 RepID=N1W6M6_9LEPT|nr:TRAP transporter small permease subunit [Leptospira vanthielii]EMY71934.1 TRAP transporter, DctQ-like membrane protein [Leptospira vanthielii serovar Holland str. Waz Holland = ATCC 700522]
MKFVERILNTLSFGEKWAGGICFLLLTLLMIADVSKREVIDKVFGWVLEVTEAYPNTGFAGFVGDWSVYIAESIHGGTAGFLEWLGLGGIIWAQKLSLYFMLWGGLFGSALASAKGSHLRPEIADKVLPKALLPYIKIVEQWVISLFFLFLAYLSVIYVLESISLDEVNPVTELHLWKVQMIFPYIFLSMGFRHLCYGIFPALIPSDINEATEALELAEAELFEPNSRGNR